MALLHGIAAALTMIMFAIHLFNDNVPTATMFAVLAFGNIILGRLETMDKR